jgi:hypothetical protein
MINFNFITHHFNHYLNQYQFLIIIIPNLIHQIDFNLIHHFVLFGIRCVYFVLDQ